METVAVVGVGLIGGSFALALREAGFRGAILGVSSPRSIEAALARGAIDEGVTLNQAAERADLIYLSQPILSIMDSLAVAGELARPGALITDAGSTKARIMAVAREKVKRALFIGGHPMAGKESRGVRAAEAGLFRGRRYILTPHAPGDLDHPAAVEFRRWLDRIGADTVVLDANEHDRRTALVSHLPQLLSTAMASLLGDDLAAAGIAGPGVMELTRLALSPWEVWRDILVTNQAHIRGALGELIHKLQDYQAKLASEELASEFTTAQSMARRLRNREGA